MANLVADVSSWNPDTPAFFQTLRRANTKAVIVKLSEGTGYRNPKAAQQVKNAWANNMHAHGYHYAQFQTAAQAEAEARYFASTAKLRGLNQTSVMALDLEDASLKGELTGRVAAFLAALKKAGYPKVDLYTSASWIWYHRVDLTKLPQLNLWIARYQATQPGVANVGTWQFTSNFQGLKVDMSYDFFGYYSHV